MRKSGNALTKWREKSAYTTEIIQQLMLLIA